MIRACLPGDRPVCSNLDELELDCLSGWYAGVKEPVGIIGSQHRPDGAVPGSAPGAQFNSVAGQKYVVARLCRRCVVDGKDYRNLLRSQYRVLNAVGNRAAGIRHSHVVVAVSD